MNHRPYLIALIGLYLLLHLLTLQYSPICWYDEVCLASETRSFLNSGKILLEANPFIFNGEVLHYGPIHFFTSSIIPYFFGFDIMQYRLAGLIFGLTSLLLAYLITFRITNNKKLSFFVILLMATDPNFFSAMHNGRMETIALTFILAGSWFLFVNIEKENWKWLWPSGLLFSLATLTTPRSGYLLIPIGVFCLFHFILRIKKHIGSVLVMSLAFIIPFLFWYLFKFENMEHFKQVFQTVSGNGNFVGISFAPKKTQYLLIVTTIVTLLVSIIFNRKLLENSYFYLILGSILAFYLFVVEQGPYNIYNIPYYYMLLGISLSYLLKNFATRKIAIFILPLIVFNLMVLGFKTMVIVSSTESRNSHLVTEFLANNTVRGETIIGDCRYFYSSINSGCDFHYINEDFSSQKFKELYDQNIDYKYIFLSNEQMKWDPEVKRIFITENFRLKASYLPKKGLLTKYLYLLRQNISGTYAGELYERK